MAGTANRTEMIRLRVTPAEKRLIEERAGGPRKVSGYLRRLGLGGPATRPEGGGISVEEREAVRERAREALARA